MYTKWYHNLCSCAVVPGPSIGSGAQPYWPHGHAVPLFLSFFVAIDVGPPTEPGMQRCWPRARAMLRAIPGRCEGGGCSPRREDTIDANKYACYNNCC